MYAYGCMLLGTSAGLEGGRMEWGEGSWERQTNEDRERMIGVHMRQSHRKAGLTQKDDSREREMCPRICLQSPAP